jgi:putative colanic acid biosynthesis acetyltransferase WcaF
MDVTQQAEQQPAQQTQQQQPEPRPELTQRLDRSNANPYGIGEYARRFLWRLVYSTLFRWSPPRAFGWRRMLLRLFGARLTGRYVFVRATTDIIHPWLLEMDEWSVLGPGVTVYNLGPVRIGRHTMVSQNVYLCAGTHDYRRADLPLERPPITIGNGVWVAACAFVGPGVTIGDNAVVGACAVVVKDVPEGMVVAGNPARVVKPREMKDA